MDAVQQKNNPQDLVTKEYLDQRLDQRLEKSEQATREYLDRRLVIFKGDIIEEMREEMREQTAEILQGVDKILTRFDAAEKDHAAHSVLHTRITDELYEHDLRIKKLEGAPA